MRTTKPLDGTIKFRLTQVDKERLFNVATEQNISVADYIRKAVLAYQQSTEGAK